MIPDQSVEIELTFEVVVHSTKLRKHFIDWLLLLQIMSIFTLSISDNIDLKSSAHGDLSVNVFRNLSETSETCVVVRVNYGK